MYVRNENGDEWNIDGEEKTIKTRLKGRRAVPNCIAYIMVFMNG
jgi:hypothetical protein